MIPYVLHQKLKSENETSASTKWLGEKQKNRIRLKNIFLDKPLIVFDFHNDVKLKFLFIHSLN